MNNLNIITGTMFSGKTNYMLNKAIELSKNYNIIYYIHKLDLDRSNDKKIFTNDNKFHDYNFIKFIANLPNEIPEYDIIFIDEFQFFNNTKNFILNCLQNNKSIFLSGLLYDVNFNQFGELLDLFIYSNNIKFLYCYCSYCKNEKGIYTIRKNQINDKIQIGSSEIYKVLCKDCYIKEKNKTNLIDCFKI